MWKTLLLGITLVAVTALPAAADNNVNIPNVPTTTTTTTTTPPATIDQLAAIRTTTTTTQTQPALPPTTAVPLIDYSAVNRLVATDAQARAGDRHAAESLVRLTFPEDPNRAVAIARRESGLVCTARNRHSSASGLMQLMAIHAGRATRLHVTWAQVQTSCLANLAVARALFVEQGWRPWRM